MASYDYDKSKQGSEKEGVSTVVTEVPRVDKEHLMRHDEQHNKDMKLAADLQAIWAKRVAAEHNYKH